MSFPRLLIVSLIFIYANSIEIENNLIETKQDLLMLKKNIIEENALINKYSWLNNINLSASYSKNQNYQTSKDYSVSLSQDVFRFGGITSTMEYAQRLKELELINLTIEYKTDMKNLYSNLIDSKILKLESEQNKLNISNSEIEIEHKTSQYQKGALGITDLNDAIIKKNLLFDKARILELSFNDRLNTLKKYTSKLCEEIPIPELPLISKENYLKLSNEIHYAEKNIKVKQEQYNIKKTDYLPRISINGSYGYKSVKDLTYMDNYEYYSYGTSISMPINFTSINNIERTKLEYLKAQKDAKYAKYEIEINYDIIVEKIRNYEDRIVLAKSDLSLYEELSAITEQEYNLGYKTLDDVSVLRNSMKIRELDIQIYNLNIMKSLLSLYFDILT